MDTCVNHQRRGAEGHCSDCNDPLCPDCVARRAGPKRFCGPCAFRVDQFSDVEIPEELRDQYPEYAAPSVPRGKNPFGASRPARPRPPGARAPARASGSPPARLPMRVVLGPVAILALVAAAYIGIRILLAEPASAFGGAVPAREVGGNPAFRTCRKNLQAATEEVKAGRPVRTSCPLGGGAYYVEGRGKGSRIYCPNARIHGFRSLYGDTGHSLVLIQR